MRDQPGIAEERLKACLEDAYGLKPVSLDFLSLGLDYRAGVYRVLGEQRATYLLKVKLGELYTPACRVPRYLSEQGVTGVVAPLPTRSGALWERLDGWNLLLYPFIDGDTSWTGMTDEHWQELGSTLRQIHQVKLPPGGFEGLRAETFDTTIYASPVHAFEELHLSVQGGSGSEQTLRSAWLKHQSTIHMLLDAMAKLAGTLRRQAPPMVICHADLHTANLIRTRAGQVFVIDWDDVMLAPRERDFIFVQEPDGADNLPPFFQGYGASSINQVALAYYRYERVIQDVVACSSEVFYQENLSEEARADSARIFQDILEPEGMLAAAARAARLVRETETEPGRSL